MLDPFISEPDLCQLVDRSIEVDDVDFAIVHGPSDNRYQRLDLTSTRELLGFEPRDEVARLNPDLQEALPERPPR